MANPYMVGPHEHADAETGHLYYHKVHQMDWLLAETRWHAEEVERELNDESIGYSGSPFPWETTEKVASTSEETQK